MTRKSTIVWIVSAIVVVGAGIGVGAAALPHSTSAAGARTSTSASAAPVGAATSSPSAVATSPAASAPPDPASPSPSSSASAGAPPAPTATTTPVGSVKSVTPALTFYQWTPADRTLEVGGNVPGLVDAGGSCVVTATQGSVTVTQSFPASAQADSTECGTMNVVSPKLTTGTWNLTIGYRSARAAGTSASTAVTL